jgi:ubiquinone/menaquinone biosynthesis C-methylase UbiE
VLDVACGTGHVALEAARVMCDGTGIDYVPYWWKSPAAQDPRSNVCLPAAGRN